MYYYRKDNEVIQIRLLEDQDFKFELDVSGWIEDNGAVTTTTWTVKSGSGTVDNTSYTAPVITGYISDTSEGVTRIEIKFSDGTGTGIQNLFVRFQDKFASYTDDYQ